MEAEYNECCNRLSEKEMGRIQELEKELAEVKRLFSDYSLRHDAMVERDRLMKVIQDLKKELSETKQELLIANNSRGSSMGHS